jgi:hypothetical protein
MRYSIGADPEGFIRNKKNGQFISAHNLIPGDKHVPHAVKNGAVQRDGVAAEFNIHPATTVDQFSENIFGVYNELLRMVKTKSKDYELVFEPTATFQRAYFSRNVPAYAKVLGCDPDFDAYSLSPNEKPKTTEPFRTGAGHIHIGWAKEGEHFNPDAAHMEECSERVKQLDLALYIPSLLWDNDQKRRELYGKVGSFRPKPYGVEYRPLSNKWVLNPKLHRYIFNTIQISLDMYDQGIIYSDIPEYEERIKRLREGHEIPLHEAYEHYFDMKLTNLCESLPREYAVWD